MFLSVVFKPRTWRFAGYSLGLTSVILFACSMFCIDSFIVECIFTILTGI